MPKEQKLKLDPDSGLPLGSIIKNHKGELGIVGFRTVIRITEEEAEELKKTK